MFDFEPKKSEKIDSDHDGLTDKEERLIYGTDPHNPDTDGDGMSDGDEVKAGRNPNGFGMIRDLLIPHQGNNYEPQILRPKRLFWHAFVVLGVKFVVVTAALLFPLSAWLTPDVLNEQSQKVVELTNKVRIKVGVNPVKVNEQLKQAALSKAEDMLVKQYFAHTNPQKQNVAFWVKKFNYKYAVAGENLALGFSSAENVVNAWIKSKTHYANLIDPDFDEIGVAMVSGVYNKKDTTLAAQIFGNTELKKNTSYLQNDNQSETAAKQNKFAMRMVQTLGDKETIATNLKTPLVAPRLLTPENNTVLNQNPLKIKILADLADKVIIEQNDTSTQPIIATWDGNLWQAEILLNEGENNLKITSQRGTESISTADQKITLDTQGPEVDLEKTKLSVDYPQGKDEVVVFGSAVLTPDTQTAAIDFSSYHIDLKLTENNLWEGSLVLFSEKDRDAVFDPAVLPTLTAVDNLGNTSVTDISWDRIIPSHTSLIKQYFLAKDQSSVSSALGKFFSWSSIYYQILLIIVGLALILNIVIKIRQQNPRVIVSSALFLMLVGAMIIF